MNLKEETRLVYGLQAKGWALQEVSDFILWIQTGEKEFRPKELDWLDEKKPSKRIGAARGRLKVPEDLDKYNDEIAELFGVEP